MGKLKTISFPGKPVYYLAILYLILALSTAIQAIVITEKTPTGELPVLTQYNNYVIFKYSHHHLLEGENLYREYPNQHWDLYKYSPTFALFFGCFAWLPDWLGLSLWNLVNVLVLFMAIWHMPGLPDKHRGWILLLVVADVITSLRNSQSNVLLAGLLLLGFGFFERRNYLLATLCIVSTFYIKLFGIAAIVVLLFYPHRGKAILYTVIWFLLLWILPAIVTGIGPLLTMYGQYGEMLKQDQSFYLGLSAMAWLKAWFDLELPANLMPLAGLAILLLPLAGFRKFEDVYRRTLFFCALMIWMVIFNHKAESPTFIIASAGVYIWYFTAARSKINIALLLLTIVFTSLAATDFFPPFIRNNFFLPYKIKVIPCILVWIKILFDLLAERKRMRNLVG